MGNTQEENKGAAGANKPTVNSSPYFFLTASFLEKVTLLLLTALVSGIVVPYITSMKAKTEIKLGSQAALLDDISETLVKYETLALDVSFFKSYPATDDSILNEVGNLYKESGERVERRYLNDVVDIFVQLRIEVIKANNLASPTVSKKLYEFHKDVLKDQDFRISALLAKDATVQEWKDMHAYNRKILARSTLLISEIATDFGINEYNHQPFVDSTYAP